jgi:O-antigen/teichoic acid export membrane protein
MIKKFFSSFLKEKTILKNIGYLSLLQFLNLGLPFISLPYLIRVLGSEVYGLIIFAQAITNYFVILVEFGFNITAVREISINRNDDSKISEIVSSVTIVKSFFFLISLLFIYLLSTVYEPIQNNLPLFFLTAWMCLYEVLFPAWFFQGIEKMKFVTVINFIFKFFFLVMIFVFVKEPEDYLIVPILNGLGAILAGGISLFIIFKNYRVVFQFVPFSKLITYTKDSLPIFISKSSQLYIKLNKVLIGNFIGLSEVAYYDLAEKIVNLMKIPISLVAQAMFPKSSRDKDLSLIGKTFFLMFIINLLLYLVIIFGGEYIVSLVGGGEYYKSNSVLRILSLTLFPITVNVFLAKQTLFAFGYKRKYTISILAAGLCYVGLSICLFFFDRWSMVSVTIIVLLSEVVTSLMSINYVYRLKLFKMKSIRL